MEVNGQLHLLAVLLPGTHGIGGLHGLRQKEKSLFRYREFRPEFPVTVYVSSLMSGLSYIGTPLNAGGFVVQSSESKQAKETGPCKVN
jgi:hypothetical protein